MGNSFTCFAPAAVRKAASNDNNDRRRSPWISSAAGNRRSKKQPTSSSSSSSSSSPTQKKKEEVILDDSYIKQQAQIASMLYQHHLQNNSDLLLHLDRSMSAKEPSQHPTKNKLQKKFSKRSRTVSSSNPLSLQLSDQNLPRNLENQENKHWVLVHGGGFGAWCWYKIIALLKENNKQCRVDAVDLAGSGSNFCDASSVATVAQYAKPLTDFLANLEDDKRVILVGHDLGGACVSHAMEMYPSKVSKAIFVAAAMLKNGQSALDVFSQQSCVTEVNRRAQKFVYAKGEKQPPTAIDFDRSLLEDLLFNRSPSKDIALASVSMRAVPFGPVAEKVSLSSANYGSIPRFYIKTEEDFVIPAEAQEAMIESDPPKEVFELKGSDHSPFFSKPQALHRFLMEIGDK